MPNSTRMNWPFPSENSAPWYDAFSDMVTALDSSGYAAREDRNLITVGGGDLSWTLGTSTLVWTADIQVVSTVTGHILTAAPATLTLDDGEIAYVNLVRSPTDSSARTTQIASQIPSSDNAFLLAMRVGANVYFRNGQRLADGETLSGLGTGPTTGGGGLNTQGVGEWKFDTDTADSDPGSGKWKLDNVDETAAAFIYLNDANNGGLDASKLIQLLATGGLVYIQRTEDSSEALLYEVTGDPTDGGGYWKIPVSYESEDTGGWAGANNKKYAFLFATAGGSGGGVAGLGSWSYVAGTPASAGEFKPDTTLANTTGTVTFFQDPNEGGRYRVAMEEVPVGTSLVFQNADGSRSHTYRIDTVTSDGTKVWYTVTYTNGAGSTDWTTAPAWFVQFLPGTALTKLDSDGTNLIYHVAKAGTPYATIAAAVAQAVTDGIGANRVTIWVHPGLYTETSEISVPGNVVIRGVSKGAARLINSSTSYFRSTGANTYYEDLLFEGNGAVATFCVEGNNQNGVHVRRCDLLNNGGTSVQGFIRQTGTTWTALFAEDCIVDSYKVSGTSIFLENTGAAARFVDAIFNNVFVDSFSGGDCIRVIGCQDVRVRNSTVRADVGRMIDLQLGGVTGVPTVKVSHCWMGTSPGSSLGVPLRNESGTSMEIFNCYYSKVDSSLLGNIEEDSAIDQFGVGSWFDSATTVAAGEMNPNNAAPASTTSITFFHDDMFGNRLRNLLDTAGPGSTLLFRNMGKPGSSHTFEVGTSSQTATEVTYGALTYTNGAGSDDWADASRWGLEIVSEGDVVGPASATDNRLVRFDGTTGKLLQDGPVGIGDDGNWTWAAGAADPVIEIYERTTAPANSAAYGKVWVKDDAPTALMFTDDVAGDLPVVTGPALALSNGVALYNGVTGHIIRDSGTLVYSSGEFRNTHASTAAFRCKERASGPTGTATHGHFWVLNDAPTTPWFTDDTDVDHNLNRPTPTTLASNEFVDVDATEVVIGGAYLDGGSLGVYEWEIVGTYNDNGGTGNQDVIVTLYERGADGAPTAGTLRSTLTVTALDTLDRVSLALTASASPGTDTDTIQDAPRFYEVRAKLDAGGGADTARILSVRFIES